MKEFIVENVVLLALLLVLVLAGIIVLLLLNLLQVRHLTEKYDFFMRGKSGQSIEESLGQCMDEVARVDRNANHVKLYVQEVLQPKAEAGLYKHYMKRYDAFEGMGGELSFVWVLLDEDNSGYLLNNVQGRENAHIYAKNIVRGECRQRLSEEEDLALKETIAYWDAKMAGTIEPPSPAVPEPKKPVRQPSAAETTAASSTAQTATAAAAAGSTATKPVTAPEQTTASRDAAAKPVPSASSTSKSAAASAAASASRDAVKKSDEKATSSRQTSAAGIRTQTEKAQEPVKGTQTETTKTNASKTRTKTASRTAAETSDAPSRPLAVTDAETEKKTRSGDDLLTQESVLPDVEDIKPKSTRSAIRPAKQSLTKITDDQSASVKKEET